MRTGMYQVCSYAGRGVRVIGSGLSIGEAAALRGKKPGSFMRFVRFPFVGN